jgi:hypothetical protein
VEFRFGASGEIVRSCAVRYRDVNGVPVPTPWLGRYGDYARVDGMMIPRSGEVEWVLPDGSRLPYWRGRITGAEYDVAR